MDIVQMPGSEAAQKYTQAKGNHLPHRAQDLLVSLVFLVLYCFCATTPLGVCCLSLLRAKPWPDVDFHDIHSSEQDDGCENGICGLVEGRVLEVVIVECNEQSKRDQADRQRRRIQSRFAIAEGRKVHQTRGVNHGQLINKLHRILAILDVELESN